MKDIKAVIFDYGNVLAKVDKSKFMRKLTDHNDMPYEDISSALYPRDSPGNYSSITADYESGKLTSEGFFEKVKEVCSLDMSIEEFRKAYTDIFYPIGSSIELARQLKPDYKLGLLSNTSEWDFQDEISKNKAFPLFDTVTLSYDVGAMKPDKQIFDDALQKLQLPPEQCLFIDDIPEYVKAAKEQGINAILYNRAEHLRFFRAELMGYGIYFR
ncbi:HAD-IA family hydrolase [Candidatus Woesearchaeota archaeon]|nr:HAD-IA family hydrolase [Candidatus Woesearchaeota archaeon]